MGCEKGDPRARASVEGLTIGNPIAPKVGANQVRIMPCSHDGKLDQMEFQAAMNILSSSNRLSSA